MQVRILRPDHGKYNPLDSGPYAQTIAFTVRIQTF